MDLEIPEHLQKYIIHQDEKGYSSTEQASWRYIMRQLKHFMTTHAHPAYLMGLESAGIGTEEIPKISEVSKNLRQLGWKALPVSGFIPPVAFMELQAAGILPIAAEIRSLDHLLYTPAPDIVHEAAGHAPMLVHPDFAEYLRRYALVAKKVIMAQKDLELFSAIRALSDLKENPAATAQEIQQAQQSLKEVYQKQTLISEGTQLGRLAWWTTEYGLIGSMDDPKIYGAGLLSSVGESEWCLGPKVKKIPLTVDCVEVGYDITEPQPQLFVTPDFKTLSSVLEVFSNRLAYRRGGLEGMNKAIEAESVNTCQLENGLQISGQLIQVLQHQNQPMYLKFKGPCQLALNEREIPNQGVHRHSAGYGTPLGKWKIASSVINPSTMTEQLLSELGYKVGKRLSLEHTTGVKVDGILEDVFSNQGFVYLMTFKDCRVSLGSQTLFEPSWGEFDLALGVNVVSVFGGPADRISFGDLPDFETKVLRKHQPSPSELQKLKLYSHVRHLRESKASEAEITNWFQNMYPGYQKDFKTDWLLSLECLELILKLNPKSLWVSTFQSRLEEIARNSPDQQLAIRRGLNLCQIEEKV